MNRNDLKIKYLASAAEYSAAESHEERILFLLSVLRFICFTGGIFLTVVAFIHGSGLGIAATMAVVMVFLLLLRQYALHTGRKEFNHNLSVVNSNEAEAVSGNISMFPAGEKYPCSDHDFSSDVDLFGKESLFQYLNRTVTGYGSDLLAEWLSDPYALSGALSARQAVIKELSGKTAWRQRFMAAGMKVPLEKTDISSLKRWLEEDAGKDISGLRKVLLFLLPSLAILSLILLLAGIVSYSLFVLLFIVNLFYVGSSIRETNIIHSSLSGRHLWISAFGSLLEITGAETFSAVTLAEMKSALSGSDVSASIAVKKLGRLVRSFDSRLNIFAGFILNGLLLWDFQCTHRLAAWKNRYRESFPGWLAILAEIDAYSSLANYAYNNNDFAWPVAGGDIFFSASKLGHPLIGEETRVSNDFTLEKSGKICIITGANMAGKSTFLRTVAVNYILAMNGAPVCAEKMCFTPARLFSSMRTTDSLAGHESYFYAELKRLRILKNKIASGEPVFFILDEILKGTNSADKAMGSRMFIKKMIMLNGTGLVATHDISLTELGQEFPSQIVNMCFEIEIEGESIRFDYRLNQGVTKKMNAAFLMKQMGILE